MDSGKSVAVEGLESISREIPWWLVDEETRRRRQSTPQFCGNVPRIGGKRQLTGAQYSLRLLH